MSHRYYYQKKLEPGDIELTGAEAHHLIHVKRAKLGERVELFDGQGCRVDAEIVELKKRAAILRIEQPPQFEAAEENVPSVILASAIPKGERFRWLIEKATEIGVTRFIPLVTERSVVSPRDSKLEKHRQYVIEACKQSGRNQLMEISPLISLEELYQNFCDGEQDGEQKEGATQIIVGQPGAENDLTNFWQERVNKKIVSLLLIVGPEGGFTESETQSLEEKDAFSICCASHILRTETAGVVMSALVIASLKAIRK